MDHGLSLTSQCFRVYLFFTIIATNNNFNDKYHHYSCPSNVCVSFGLSLHLCLLKQWTYRSRFRVPKRYSEFDLGSDGAPRVGTFMCPDFFRKPQYTVKIVDNWKRFYKENSVSQSKNHLNKLYNLLLTQPVLLMNGWVYDFV